MRFGEIIPLLAKGGEFQILFLTPPYSIFLLAMLSEKTSMIADVNCIVF